MTNQDVATAQRLWDHEADSFDDVPDHGLHDPIVREAWRSRLTEWLPSHPAKVLDVGCGTGSLSVLLAEQGYEVIGTDISPVMLERARAKAAVSGKNIGFLRMDAAGLRLGSEQFDVIMCRHLLWMLPEPSRVLQSWTDLLLPGGRLVLIEGYWHTGAGMHTEAILDALPPSLGEVHVNSLNTESVLWGREVTDERYVVTATRTSPV